MANPNANKPGPDRVGDRAKKLMDLVRTLLRETDWAVETGAEFRDSDPSLLERRMNRTRDLLAALGKLLGEPVFGDHEAFVEVSQLHNIRRDLNEFFKANSLPFKATVANGYLALKNASPQPARASRKAPTKPKRHRSHR